MSSPGAVRRTHAALATLLLYLLKASEAALVAPADLQVMMQLKQRFSPKVALPSWQGTADCSTWDKVTCDRTGRVLSLYFMRTKIGGPFPTIVTQLDALTSIYMDGNNFTGPMPSELGQLRKLIVLRLNSNSLSGGLPASLGNLTQLVKLWLGRNGGLNGTIPSTWARLPLQEASFERNKFSGPVPASICNWTNAHVLRLSRNPWTGDIPSCLSRLTKLQYLYLDYAGPRFGGSFPEWIGNLESLRNLFLNNNGISGQIPSSIGRLTNLDTFFVASNNISGPLPSTLSRMVNLKAWVQEFNKISGPIPHGFSALTNLERILLDNNRMSGSIPATLGNLSKLTILLLEGNFFYGTVPAAIPQGCRSLVYFNLENNQLSGQPPTNFSSTGLRQINIRSNYFVGRMDYRTTSGQRICPPMFIPDSNSHIISSTKFNCLTGNSTCGPAYDEQQKSPSQCADFCSTSGPDGLCNGKGFCRFLQPTAKRMPRCRCFPGYRRTKNGRGCR